MRSEEDVTMPPAVEAALGRLRAAVTRLQAAADRAPGARAGEADRDAALGAMQDDRARLARELDAALAREAQLRHAQAAIADRLGRAERSIGSALARLDEEGVAADDTASGTPSEPGLAEAPEPAEPDAVPRRRAAGEAR